MPKKKPTALYRTLIRDAWKLTLERKALWVFGIFAALITTGGVVDVALASLKKVRSGSNLLEQLFSSSFVGYDLFAQYVQQLHLLGPTRTSWLIAITTLCAIALFIMAIVSQAALVLGAKSKHTPEPYKIRKEALAHFWDLFVIAVLTKLFNAILIMLLTLPLVLLYIQTTTYNAWLFFLMMLVFLPAIVIVNIIAMLSLMDIVHKGHRPLHAISYALNVFKRQWLGTLEFGLLLFMLVFSAGLLLTGLLVLFAIPYSVIYTVALLSGSYTVFLVANVISALAVVMSILIFGGAAVTFQYTAWYQFYKRAMHKTHGKKPISKYLRWFKA